MAFSTSSMVVPPSHQMVTGLKSALDSLLQLNIAEEDETIVNLRSKLKFYESLVEQQTVQKDQIQEWLEKSGTEGETVAIEFLRRRGFNIIQRGSPFRPNTSFVPPTFSDSTFPTPAPTAFPSPQRSFSTSPLYMVPH